MRPIKFPLVLIAILMIARPAAAWRDDTPVKIRLVGTPAQVQSFAPFEATLEIVAGRDVQLKYLQPVLADAAGLVIDLPSSLSLAEGESRRFPFRLTPGGPDPMLSLSFFESDREFRSRLPLARIRQEWESGSVGRLVDPEKSRDEKLRWPDKKWPGVPDGIDPGAEDDDLDTLADIHIEKNAAARTIRIHGRILYHRYDGQLEYADGWPFEVYDEDTTYDDMLATGRTDENGLIDVTFSWDPCAVCETNPDIYVEVYTHWGQVDVQTDHLERTYGWDTPVWVDYTGNDIGFGQMEIETNVPAANIFQWYLRGLEMMSLAGWTVPAFDVQWPGWDTYYVSVFDEIHIAPDAEWEEYAYYHEYGHLWQTTFADQSWLEYNNAGGWCDGDWYEFASHCTWCQENQVVAQAEGLCDFISFTLGQAMISKYDPDPGVIKHRDEIEACVGTEGPCTCSPKLTEGFVTAFMQDLGDTTSDNDGINSAYSDEMDLNPWDLLVIADDHHPHTFDDWWGLLQSHYPDQMSQIWATAMNNGFDLDSTPPTNVTGLTCLDHVVGVASPDATLGMTWNPSSDTESGVVGYTWSVTTSPGEPDGMVDTEFTHATTDILAPGTYYFNVRAVDRKGYGSPTTTSTGPYVIREPRQSDLHSDTSGGWTLPIVATSEPHYDTSGPPLSPVLAGTPGDTYWHYKGINEGESEIPEQLTNTLFVDGNALDSSLLGGGSPDMPFGFKNLGPVQIPSGLHAFSVMLDQTEVAPETNENNNLYGYQFVWEPPMIAPNTQVLQVASPPRATGGWEGIVPPYSYNCLGYRFDGSGYWNAVYMLPFDADADFHLRLHEPSTGSTSGFGNEFGWSSRPPGLLQAVLVNRNTAGWRDWDVGILNAGDIESGFRIKQVTSTHLGTGGTVSFGWTYLDVLSLFEFRVDDTADGAVSIVVDSDDPDIHYHIARVDANFTTGSLLDARDFAESQPVPTGRQARLDLDIERIGYHGVVIWREQLGVYGTYPNMTIDVHATPPDLVPFTDSDWCGPLVPRDHYANTPYVVSCPDTLLGNTDDTSEGTWLATCVNNLGPEDAHAVQCSILLDGQEILTHEYYAMLSGIKEKVFFPAPIHVPGGRHTLSLHLDDPEAIAEISEENNIYARQWVWSPEVLSYINARLRNSPPDRHGGLSDLMACGQTPYVNCDGLRLPTPRPSQLGNWHAVAVMPTDSCDVNVHLFELEAEMAKRYTAILEGSTCGPGQLDYLLIDNHLTPKRGFDVGVYQMSGQGTYYAWAVNSTILPTQNVYELSDVAMSQAELLDLYELDLTPGNWTFTLEARSGDVNWGLSLHKSEWDAFQARHEAVEGGTAWLEPSNTDESFVLEIPEAGNYCLAVWKATSDSMAGTASYSLRLSRDYTGVGDSMTPIRTGLVTVYPNPFNPRARVIFDLAEPGDATVEVYNVKGQRIRTLSYTGLPAARHEAVWDGTDFRGIPAASGSYFLRLRARGASADVQKAVLVR